MCWGLKCIYLGFMAVACGFICSFCVHFSNIFKEKASSVKKNLDILHVFLLQFNDNLILWCGLCNMNNTYLFYNPDILPKFWAAPLYVIITTTIMMMTIIIIRGINNIIFNA